MPVSDLRPNRVEIEKHLTALFPPKFDPQLGQGLIEIAWSNAAGIVNQAQLFAYTDIEKAADIAFEKNEQGANVYVGACVRHPNTAPFGRCSDEDAWAATAIWSDMDDGDAFTAGLQAMANAGLPPSFGVKTGSIPSRRGQPYVALDAPLFDMTRLRDINVALHKILPGSDPTVINPGRILRLAGTINWPTERKAAKGRVPEVTEFGGKCARFGLLDITAKLKPAPSNVIDLGLGGRTDAEIIQLLEATRTPGQWHQSMLRAVATMIGRGWPDAAIRAAAAPYCTGGFHDADLTPMLTGGRTKWEKPNPAEGQAGPIAPPSTIKATGFSLVDEGSIPRRQWVYGDRLIRGYVAATVSPGGIGKSSLTIVESLAMVSGKPLLGHEVKEPMRVWLWNLEDGMDELQRRIVAACKHYKLTAADIGDRLFVDSGRVQELIIAARVNREAIVIAPVVEAIIEQMTANKIDVLIVDPFVSAHRLGENDNGEIDLVVKALNRVAERANAAIEVVHHSRKTQNEVTVDDARGASSLLAAVRSARALNGMTIDEADRYGATERWRFFRAYNGKANLAPRSDESVWFRMETVALNNGSDFSDGDKVGVATVWEPPGAFDGFNPDAVGSVFNRIETAWTRDDPFVHGRGVRKDNARAAWKMIAEVLECSEAQAKRAIETWLGMGTLYTEEHRRDGKTRQGLRVDRSKTD